VFGHGLAGAKSLFLLLIASQFALLAPVNHPACCANFSLSQRNGSPHLTEIPQVSQKDRTAMAKDFREALDPDHPEFQGSLPGSRHD